MRKPEIKGRKISTRYPPHPAKTTHQHCPSQPKSITESQPHQQKQSRNKQTKTIPKNNHKLKRRTKNLSCHWKWSQYILLQSQQNLQRTKTIRPLAILSRTTTSTIHSTPQPKTSTLSEQSPERNNHIQLAETHLQTSVAGRSRRIESINRLRMVRT